MATETVQTLQDFLTAAQTGPFVTLYLPLEAGQSVEKTKLIIRHLLNHTQEVMTQTAPAADFSLYERALNAHLGAQPLVDAAGQGVGLITDGHSVYQRALEYPVSQLAMVTALPQILPMILDDERHLDFDLLMLQRDRIDLYLNLGDQLTKTALPEDAPLTLLGTLGEERRGGSVNTVAQGSGQVSYHGHSDRASEEEVDQRRYYQAVDTYIADHYSKPNARRLVLFGLPQNLALFREVSRNSYLSGSMQVELNPGNLSFAAIDLALDDLRMAYSQRQAQKLLAQLDNARGAGKYLDALGSIVAAVQQRALATLVIRQGARIRGRLVDDQIETESPQAQHNNLLNDLAAMTVAQGGVVKVLPSSTLSEEVVGISRYAAQ